MSPEHILPVLYDLALSIGSEIRLKPLLTRFLQRALYHTSFPAGIVFLDLSQVDPLSGMQEGRISAVMGDYKLLEQEGQTMRLPAALLCGDVAQQGDATELLEQLGHGCYHSFLRLPIEGAGVILLLAPFMPETELPLVQMFQPVLAHLANAVRLCRENEERTAQLEAANRELEAFAYSVSHDLRTPLRAIDGFSNILLEDYADKLDDEGKRILNVVRGNTIRMGQLIDDILQFSRAGRLEIRLSVVDMEGLARDVLAELLVTANNGNLQVDIGSLPPCKGDSAMMRQVFVNLLSNAIKFSGGNKSPLIKVGGFVGGGEAVYFVQDNGVGFDMQYVDKLFGVFQRLHGVDEFDGTGIGLAIVKRIITRHGGRVWAEGRVNEGATMYFSLPLKEK